MSSTFRIEREAVGFVTLPPDVTPMQGDWGSGLFRPATLTERVTECFASGEEDDIRYVVTLRGPKVTKTGKDHLSHKGTRSYIEVTGKRRDILRDDIANIPEPIAQFLTGKDNLSKMIQEAGL